MLSDIEFKEHIYLIIFQTIMRFIKKTVNKGTVSNFRIIIKLLFI